MKRLLLCLLSLLLGLKVHSQSSIFLSQTKPRTTKIEAKDNKLDTTSTKPIVLKNLLFSRTSEIISPASYDELNELARYLIKHRTFKVTILGHTEMIGDPQQNLELSRDRAKAVRNFLVSRGVERERINYLGFGSTMPLDTTNTEEIQKKNRRVEFQIIRE